MKANIFKSVMGSVAALVLLSTAASTAQAGSTQIKTSRAPKQCPVAGDCCTDKSAAQATAKVTAKAPEIQVAVLPNTTTSVKPTTRRSVFIHR